MKKTFPLADPDNRHKPERVVEQIKSDIRKYIKRERGKKVPEEFDFWDFDCRSGKDEPSAIDAHVNEIMKGIDQAAGENWPAIYIEILAKPIKRSKKPTVASDEKKTESLEPPNAN